jgi:prevent-host-death family protein
MALRIGSRELKNRLGRYLQLVREGRTIVITLRGEPVAELRPVSRDADSVEAALDRMAAEGKLTRATKRSMEPFTPVLSGVDLVGAINEDREDRI